MADKKFTTKVSFQNLAELLKDNFALKKDIPENVSDLTNDEQFQTKTEVDAAIAAKLSSTYKAGGSVESPDYEKLTATYEGTVYNVSKAFATDATHFVDGVDKKYPAGTNIVVVKNDGGESYLYDVLAGFVDLSEYATTEAVDGKLADYAKTSELTSGLAGKQDKLTGTEGQIIAIGPDGTAVAQDAPEATTVEESENGKIKVNGEDITVYTLPSTVIQESDVSDYTKEELESLLGLSE